MKNHVYDIINGARSKGRSFLLEPEAKEVCRLHGIPITSYGVAGSIDEAVTLSKEIGFPVVLKIVSPDILHKSDAGGVVLDLKTSDGVREAYEEILANAKRYKSDAKIAGILVQEMAPSSTEVIIGMTTDPQFGPTLMFGLGGIFVEVFQDVAFRVAPIEERDAYEMIREIKAYSILQGVRGKEPSDVKALADILLRVSKLVMEYREIEQLDLNPVLAYSTGAKVVDARIILAKQLTNE